MEGLPLIVYHPCFLVTANSKHKDCGKHTRAHIQRSEDAAMHFEKRGGRNLISICRGAASTSVQTICFAKRIGLHLYPSVLIVLLHKSKDGVGGGGKTKTKQRDIASGLGIFLLPRKGCAINNRGRKQPGWDQRQNCSTSCWMKTQRGTPRVVNKEFPAALLAIQKAKVERVTVLCQQVGGEKNNHCRKIFEVSCFQLQASTRLLSTTWRLWTQNCLRNMRFPEWEPPLCQSPLYSSNFQDLLIH